MYKNVTMKSSLLYNPYTPIKRNDTIWCFKYLGIEQKNHGGGCSTGDGNGGDGDNGSDDGGCGHGGHGDSGNVDSGNSDISSDSTGGTAPSGEG
jgi:hypothetical protein